MPRPKGKARPGANAVAEKTLALMREVTGLPIFGSTEKQLHNALRSGVLLVAYVNKLFPSHGVDAHRGGIENKILANDNIQKFLKAARAAGVIETHLFSTEDIHSGRGLARVHACLAAMRSLASARKRPQADGDESVPGRRLRGSITTQDGLPPPPHDLVEDDDIAWLTDRGAGAEIPLVEARAVTLAQLEEVLSAIRERCARGGQWWCLEQSDEGTPSWESRALSSSDVHLDHFLHTVARPATRERNCSFVELVATEAQPAEWVVSVVWAEPVETLVACLRRHAADRGYTRESAVWIDAFAGRRADFAAPLPPDLADAPFCRAAAGARGMLVVLDSLGALFDRVGFGLELHAALTAPSDNFFTDAYAAFVAERPPSGGAEAEVDGDGGGTEQHSARAGGGGGGATEMRVERITDGELVSEDLYEKAVREGDFSHDLAERGLRFALADASALPARARDKQLILEHVAAGVGAHALDATVRAIFLLAKLPAIASHVGDDDARATFDVALRAALPLARCRRVRLTFGGDVAEDWVAQVVVPSLPPSVRSLALTECSAPSLCSALRAHLLVHGASTLTALDLSCDGIGADGAAALAAVLRPDSGSALRTLELFGNPLGDAGVSALSESLELDPPLQSLGLQAVAMADAGACSLAAAIACNTQLVQLVLRGNEIGDEGAYFLAEGLKCNGTLLDLDLFCNAIEERGAQMLARALHEPTCALNALNLDTNDVGDEGAAALADALKVNAMLLELDLGSNRERNTGATSHLIGERGAAALADALASNSTLTRLDVGGNVLGNKGATSLSDALGSNTALLSLALYSNRIDERGANAISTALTLSKALRELDINSNQIGDTGALAIAEALATNDALLKLNVSGCAIGDVGAAAFANALSANSCLLTLKLGHNHIGADGAAALANGLRMNTTLVKLGLGENRFGDEGAEALADALEANTSLARLFLWHNALSADAKERLRAAWMREGRLDDNLVV